MGGARGYLGHADGCQASTPVKTRHCCRWRPPWLSCVLKVGRRGEVGRKGERKGRKEGVREGDD